MNCNTFIFVGSPGSGKGTQAKFLSEKLGLSTFSIGRRLREIVAENSALGKKVGEVIDKGELMPSWFVLYFCEEVLFNLKENEGIIFDGVGRKKEEAEIFSQACFWLGRDFKVIFIDVPEDVVKERIEKRRQEGRKDDAPERLVERFKNYHKHTLPAIEHFRSIGKLIEVNGHQSPEEVFSEVWEKVSSLCQ